MTTKVSQIEFFRDGLSHYPDARETVNYFQTCVREAISRAFEAKTSWNNFEPFRVNGSLESGGGMGDVFIQAWIAGTLPNRSSIKEKVWISLGLVWKPSYRPSASVVAASHCWSSVTNTSVPFNRPKTDSGVALGRPNKKGERRMLLEPGADFDPEVSFALLLDAVDDALGVAETVRDATRDAQ